MPLYTTNPKLNPKPKNNFGFHKSLSSILSDVEKFTEFKGTIIFQISAKGIAQKLWRRGRLESTLVVNTVPCLSRQGDDDDDEDDSMAER